MNSRTSGRSLVELLRSLRDPSTEEPARSRVLDEIRQWLVATLRRRLPARDAPDVAHDVLLALHLQLPTVSVGSEPQWLRSVVRNQVVSYYRRQKKWTAIPVAGDEAARDVGYSPAAQTPSVLARDCLRILDSLPEKMRRCAVDSLVHGYTTKEIAARWDIEESTVRVQVRNARLRLKDFVAGNCGGPRNV